MSDYHQKSKEALIEELQELKQKYELLLLSKKEQEDASDEGIRLKSFFDLLPQTVFKTDSQWQIVYSNEYAYSMFGLNKDDFHKGVNIFDFLEPESAKKALSNISKIKSGKETDNKEYLARRKDGSCFPVYIYSKPIIDSGGFQGLFGIVVDISAQKKKDEQLLFMETVMDKSAQPVIWVDNTGSVLYMNNRACEIAKKSREEITGKKVWEVNPGHTKERWIESWEELKKKKETVQVYSFINKYDEKVFVESHSHYINFGSKSLSYTYLTDITEKMKTENEIKKISHAIDQSSNSIVITDTDGNIEYINRRFLKVTGFKAEEVIGKKSGILKSGYTPKEVYKNLWETVSSGREWRGEFLNKKKNGEFFWESALISPVKNENGVVTNYLAVKEDINDKKELELELKRALDRAEELSKLKSSLLANMNHEIRTPLTGILGMSQILNEELSDPYLVQFAKNISISGKRLMTTLNSIIDLSELEADNTQINITHFYLGSQIKYILGQYIETAEHKGVKFNFNIEDDSITAYTDQRLCNQIIMNLVDNAVKYTENGSITVSVSPKEDSDNLWLKLSVKDTGIGISEDNLEFIFEEFRQISEGINRSFEGSGLGLALVKKMLPLIGGKIEVKSKKDVGSEFIVYFPAAKAVEQPLDEELLKIDVSTREPDDACLPLILLVEDNDINSEVVFSFLKDVCVIERASSGEEAIEMASQQEYELILMDINLGIGMDGLQAAKEIRKQKEYEDTPIVAVTGYAMSADKKRFLEQGIQYYLAKPFTKDEITRTVTGVLEKKDFVNL